ncbi:MAG: hypothetical protein Kow0099_33190 [Candidatus Abyssubacteria bacterium]
MVLRKLRMAFSFNWFFSDKRSPPHASDTKHAERNNLEVRRIITEVAYGGNFEGTDRMTAAADQMAGNRLWPPAILTRLS